MNEKHKDLKLGTKVYQVVRDWYSKTVDDSYKIVEWSVVSMTLENDKVVYRLGSDEGYSPIFNEKDIGVFYFLSFEKAKRVLNASVDEEKESVKRLEKIRNIEKYREENIGVTETLIGESIFIKTKSGWEISKIKKFYTHSGKTRYSFIDDKYHQMALLNKEGKTWFFENDFYKAFENKLKLLEQKEKLLESLRVLRKDLKTEEKVINSFKEKEAKDAEITVANILLNQDKYIDPKRQAKDTPLNSGFSIKNVFYTCPRCRTKSGYKSKQDLNVIVKCPKCDQRVKIVTID